MNKNVSRSLVVQMLVLVLLLLVLPISIAGYYLYSYITDDLTQMEKERVYTSTQSTNSLIQKFGENLLGVTKTNSHWEDNRVAVGKKDVNWIKENVDVGVNVIPNLDFIATCDFDGNVISQVGDVKEFTGTLANPKILEQIKEKGDFSGVMQTSKGLAVIAVSKITNEDGTAEPTGVLIFGRLIDNKELDEIKGILHDDIALLTNEGNMFSTSNKITKDSLSKYITDNQHGTGLQIFKTSYSDSVHSAEMITTLKDFTKKPIGVLYISQKQVTSTEVQSELKNVNIIIGMVLVIIMALLVLIVYCGIIIPIRNLVMVSEDVSKGILSSEINQKIIARKDELGRLGQSMNIMIINFRNLIQEVAGAIEHVSSSSKDLSSNFEETTRATHQIVSAIQDVASGSETQLQATTESARAMKEMANSIQYIAEKISAISTDSKQTLREAQQGNKTIQETVRQMETIDESVNASASVVKQLGERTKEINQIVTLITTIADQTNLLALNAAIEAARAGEQGRGFAVVADEVRKLAEQTASSAKQVSDLIGAIQKESVYSVESMDQINKEVSEGLRQIYEVGQVFESILRATHNVAQQTQEVSAMSEQMSASTEQVSSSVETLANIARNTANSTHNVASSSQEQLASMEEIASSSMSLSKIAQNLKELIGKFGI